MVSPLKVTASMYDSLYVKHGSKGILQRLDKEISTSSKLGSLDCNGFLTCGDLQRFLTTLSNNFSSSNVNSNDQILLDLGCGLGGLGWWLASQLKCRLIGIDFSSVAISKARDIRGEDLIPKRYSFEVADFTETGLNDKSVAGVISLDALYLASTPTAALAEVYRVLVPGGVLLFTVYTNLTHQNYPDTSELIQDWSPLLKLIGFRVERYEDRSCEWRHKMRIKHQYRWDRRDQIRSELGLQAEAELAVSAAMLGLSGKPSFLDNTARFEIISLRPRH
jgi:ubiquinone/menaquinone biosynthesis C-methylase UbiE